MKIKQPLVIASNNEQKTSELIKCFAYLGYQAVSYQQFLPRQRFPSEGTDSYLVNAERKARFIAAQLPDQWVVADDSGMVLAADPNGLGVQTARQLSQYADDEHRLNQRILQLVDGQSRDVTMTTTLVLIKNQRVVTGHGEFKGQVATSEQGDNGSSFDLILVPTGMDQTLARLTDQQKLPRLHRTKAIQNLLVKLQETD